MKLTAIEANNFLSHSRTRVEFNGARLVSLVGANGAGKSSLLDAALYTLYDSARAKTDDLVRLGETDMSAAVEFQYGGALYRAERGRTTRSGGRSYLELQIRQDDGSWRPLTADTIRDTQAEIERLLHVDGDTFTSAVMLRQGSISQFVEATASERKRVLGSILGLDRYKAAEDVAKTRAVELASEQRHQAERIERLTEQIGQLEFAPALLSERAPAIAHLEAEIVTANADRAVADKRLQELAAELATGEAAESDVIRLGAEIAVLLERFNRTKDRLAGADRMAAMAAQTLTAAEAVEADAARIPELQARVAEARAREAEAIALDERIRTSRDAHAAATADSREASATWTARYEAARAQVDELAAAVVALAPVTCPKCGESIVIDQAGLQERLTLARRAFRALEANRPTGSTSAGRDAAAILRLDDRRRELGDVRSPVAEASGELSRLEAQAARRDGIAQARETARQAVADREAALGEQAEISRAGSAARLALTAAQAQVATLEEFRAERTAVTDQLVVATKRLPELAREHASAIADVIRLQGLVAQLEQTRSEHAGLEATRETTAVELGRMKRLAAAFGVSGIPARITESVLPELTGYAQELLSALRPGMELEIRAQRAKRDGKGVIDSLDLVVRDAAGERPLVMFSGGERMSVSLALAVGLSRLVARRAGAALKTLVIDEPDGLDGPARRAFGQALRVLAHHGELERVLMVSHHEDLAEFGDSTYRVTKGSAGSLVEQL